MDLAALQLQGGVHRCDPVQCDGTLHPIPRRGDLALVAQLRVPLLSLATGLPLLPALPQTPLIPPPAAAAAVTLLLPTAAAPVPVASTLTLASATAAAPAAGEAIVQDVTHGVERSAAAAASCAAAAATPATPSPACASECVVGAAEVVERVVLGLRCATSRRVIERERVVLE